MILFFIVFKSINREKHICHILTYQKMIYTDCGEMNKLLLIIAVKHSLSIQN